MKVTNFWYNLQQPTKKIDVQKCSKTLSELDIAAHLVYNILAKKFSMSFTAKKRKNNRLENKRSSNKNNQEEDLRQKKSAKPKVDESKKKTDKNTSRKDWAFYR